jgi:uncharacterized protein
MEKAEKNRKLINEYLDCFERGDVERGQSYWAEDAVFFQAGHSHLAGTYHSPRDFIDRWIQPLLKLTNNRWGVNSNPEVILSGDDGCVVIINEHMIRDGKGRIDTKKLVVYTLREDKITSCRMYDGDQGAIDDFWS